MHVGVMIFDTDYSMPVNELAVALEERGFESLFVPEHTHIPASRESAWPGGADLPRDYWHTFDPFVSLSFAAAATTKLKVGTGICLLPQRDTIVAAKLVASLDRMSGGRFLFGIGGGWNKEEMGHHGVAYNQRFARMEEQIAAMKGLWQEEEFGYEGDHVKFTPSWAHPKPVQTPNPPILLGGETDYTLRRVVNYCDGWLPRARHGFDAAENMTRLREIADSVGRSMETLCVTVFGAPGDRATLASYQEAGIERALLGLPSADKDVVLPMLDKFQGLLK
ncbi:MAG: LLM class F420-dependent oxidoreductase [Gammaproteobacteria bacterium]|nr:LLM class F420-dependent oxidoreductase [Gammaproteobacteria bacterium]RPG27562.1 MAG: LLM class F420-dependent oxidoreductase [Gammaproteobacteria bacterium TMED50]|tara:strand:- start:16368 stop:17204 length:837 start_codon:yes stop_codon:yes gene_type:complete